MTLGISLIALALVVQGYFQLAHFLQDKAQVRLFSALVDNQIALMANGDQIRMDLKKLQDAVAQETTVEQGTITLLQALVQELKDANNSGDQAAVDAVADQILANTTALAAAVASVPPAPAQPESPATT